MAFAIHIILLHIEKATFLYMTTVSCIENACFLYMCYEFLIDSIIARKYFPSLLGG